MKPLRKIITIVSLLLPLGISAQVDESQILQFQAGTPARAADMNQNIQTLIAAINSNTAQLKSLQDQMAVIASVTNLPEPSLQQDLAGSVYRIGFFVAESGTGTNKIRQKIYGSDATLTLNVDGSIALTVSQQEREVNLSFAKIADPANVIDVIIDKQDLPETETINGTWSITGSSLTLNFGGDPETFHVSVDGNTIFNSSRDTYNDGGYNMFAVNMRVGVRISKPQPNIEVVVESVFNGGLIFTPVNNGASELVNDTNAKAIVIKNTGTGNLVLGSSAMVQEAGGDFTLTEQTGSVTIAPNAEYRLLELVNPLSQGSTRRDSAIYLMSNDPDTPTFIVNVHSTNNP